MLQSSRHHLSRENLQLCPNVHRMANEPPKHRGYLRVVVAGEPNCRLALKSVHQNDHAVKLVAYKMDEIIYSYWLIFEFNYVNIN